MVSKLILDFMSDGGIVRSIKFVPSGFIDGQDEVECGFPKRVKLRNGVTITVEDVPLPDELCDVYEGARDVACVAL